MISSLAFAVAILLIMAPTTIFATGLADSDCYAPKANGGLGYCGPSEVCLMPFRSPLLQAEAATFKFPADPLIGSLLHALSPKLPL